MDGFYMQADKKQQFGTRTTLWNFILKSSDNIFLKKI